MSEQSAGPYLVENDGYGWVVTAADGEVIAAVSRESDARLFAASWQTSRDLAAAEAEIARLRQLLADLRYPVRRSEISFGRQYCTGCGAIWYEGESEQHADRCWSALINAGLAPAQGAAQEAQS